MQTCHTVLMAVFDSTRWGRRPRLTVLVHVVFSLQAICKCSTSAVSFPGGVWADQLVHWRRYQHQWLTIPLLALVTAVLAILGLLPLMNNFAHIAGFVAGFLACFVALLNRRVRIFHLVTGPCPHSVLKTDVFMMHPFGVPVHTN